VAFWTGLAELWFIYDAVRRREILARNWIENGTNMALGIKTAMGVLVKSGLLALGVSAATTIPQAFTQTGTYNLAIPISIVVGIGAVATYSYSCTNIWEMARRIPANLASCGMRLLRFLNPFSS